MVNPVPGFKVTTAYKKRGRLWSLGFHTGADIAAPKGTTIVSATPGRVIAANAWDEAYGYKVIIRWGDYDVWYCHLPKNAATVKVNGGPVRAGQKIGVVGTTGKSTGPHLHMELRVAGGRFAAENFRDPAKAIAYDEAPAEVDDSIGKWELVNHGAATVALKRPGGYTKWLRRRKRLVIITRDKNPDVLGGLECGGGSAWRYIRTKYKKFGQVLVVTAGGRSLWRNAKTTEASIDSGVYKPKAHEGDIKEVPWFVAKVNGAKMLTALAHLDSDASAAFNVKVIDQILYFLQAKATEHKLGLSQVVLMIDTADKTGAVRERMVKRGFGSIFKVADKKVNADLASMTYYKAPTTGSSVDDIFVWVGNETPGKGPDKPRPVSVASKTPGAKPTDLDHLVLAAVLERQA